MEALKAWCEEEVVGKRRLTLAGIVCVSARTGEGMTQAGVVLGTTTPPTLNPRLPFRAAVSASIFRVSHAPTSVECSFSMTLLPGHRGHV
jgi:hypothetical protein